MSGEIPSERWQSFAMVAGASRERRVLVLCRSATVRRQYQRAIPKLGGNLDNVVFHILSSVTKERTPS